MGTDVTVHCEWCGGNETVKHVIMYCKKYYIEERVMLLEEMRRKDVNDISLKYLLNPEQVIIEKHC